MKPRVPERSVQDVHNYTRTESETDWRAPCSCSRAASGGACAYSLAAVVNREQQLVWRRVWSGGNM